MTPQRANDLIPEFAKEAGMDESHVRAILNQYWGMIQDQLDKGNRAKVYIPNLGCFDAIPKAIEKRLNSFRRYPDAIGPDGTRDKNDTVKRLESIMYEITSQRKICEQKRALRRAINSGSTQALEEPEVDI